MDRGGRAMVASPNKNDGMTTRLLSLVDPWESLEPVLPPGENTHPRLGNDRVDVKVASTESLEPL